MILLLAAEPQVTDPLALIIGAGGAIIASLCSLLLTIVFANNKAIREELKSLRQAITGDGGMTVGLVTRITTLEGESRTARARIESLERGTLTREIFERETGAQNSRLEELKTDTRSLTSKVDKLDRSVASRPWSQASMAAVRPVPREEPPSDPPAPPRPKLPSRPR